MANKIVTIDLPNQPFIRIYVINNSRHVAHIEGNEVYTKAQLNDIARKIKIKLDKDIVLDHYDPILNNLIFYA